MSRGRRRTVGLAADLFTEMGASVTILAGERFAFVPIVPINNYFVESNRTVRLNVLPGAGYNNSAGTASLTIVDDDLPNIGVYPSDPIAAHGGGNHGTFTVTRSGDVTRDPYVDDVRRGLRFLMSTAGQLTAENTIQQGANSPDSNGNGFVLYSSRNDHQVYLSGQVIDAIVASGTPTFGRFPRRSYAAKARRSCVRSRPARAASTFRRSAHSCVECMGQCSGSRRRRSTGPSPSACARCSAY